MLTEFAWNAFEKTGNIDFYVFYKEVTGKNHQIIETDAEVTEVAISS